MTSIRLVFAALLVLSVLAGCSDGDDDGVAPEPAGTLASNGTQEPTEPTDGTTGTSDPTSPSPTVTGTLASSQPTDGTITADLASGSGCTPPAGDGLPDGRWYGLVPDLDDTGSTSDVLPFDLACWFDGEAAVQAAAEDGAESPPPNDYHIRNDNPLVRQLPVDPDVEVNWLANSGDPATMEPIDLIDWRTERTGMVGRPGVWIDIIGGLVVAIEEQYVP